MCRLTKRALAGWLVKARAADAVPPGPHLITAEVCEYNGIAHVMVTAADGTVLAGYRICGHGARARLFQAKPAALVAPDLRSRSRALCRAATDVRAQARAQVSHAVALRARGARLAARSEAVRARSAMMLSRSLDLQGEGSNLVARSRALRADSQAQRGRSQAARASATVQIRRWLDLREKFVSQSARGLAA